MLRVLVTSIGSLSAISAVMCMQPVRASLNLVATNSIARAAGNFLADRVVLVPETSDATGWKAAIERLVDEEKPDLVLNGRDEELPLLAHLHDRLVSPPSPYLCPPPFLGDRVADKYLISRFAAEHGLPFAETAYYDREVEQMLSQHGLPVIAKPRLCGHASKGVRLLRSEPEVRAALEKGTYVFQELLRSPLIDDGEHEWESTLGIPWSWSVCSIDHEIDLLIDGGVLARCFAGGIAEGAFNRDIWIVDEPDMLRVADAYGEVLARLGYRGPLNLQGRLMPDGRYVPFELNARFTGTMIGKAHLGFNLVLAALHHWGGNPPTPVPLRRNDLGAQRLPTFFLTFDERAADVLSGTGEWRRS